MTLRSLSPRLLPCLEALFASYKNIVHVVVGSQATIRFGGRHLSSALFLYLSLFLLRHQAVCDLALSYPQAMEQGLSCGFLFDLSAVLAVLAGALGAATVLAGSGRWLWLALASVVWLSALGNLLYFRFFGCILEWWLVRYHLSDVPLVRGAAAELGWTPTIAASLGAFLSGLWLAGRGRAPRPSAVIGRGRQRLVLAGLAAVLAVSIGCVRQAPFLLDLYEKPGSRKVLEEQVLQVWAREMLRGPAIAWKRQAVAARARRGGEPAPAEILDRGRLLASFRDGGWPIGAGPAAGEGAAVSSWPLSYSFDTPPALARERRRAVGLPEEGPIHVVVLFVESLRTFELQHRELGPQVFPHLRKSLNEHGIHFNQAYASSLVAGQSVRGQFSGLCAMLPNILGVATYIGYPTLSISCLPELLKERGYSTMTSNGFDRSHHNKSTFEYLHGIEEFYDDVFFHKQGVEETIGTWGLADRPVLEETLKLLEAKGAEKPFFASVLTSSSHFPFQRVEDPRLPPSLVEEMADHPQYLAYLSVLHYVDRALGEFLDGLFSGLLGERLLVVLLADHSVPIRPPFDLTPIQRKELEFRIPLAILTRDMPNPRRVHGPVHQIDVAPTVARIVGISSEVEWLGRDLLAGSGSPWVYQEEGRVHYRTRDRGCYSLTGSGMRCLALRPGRDPLYETAVSEVDPRGAETRYYLEIVETVGDLIRFDSFQPPASTAWHPAEGAR